MQEARAKGVSGFECWTGGPGGGVVPEGLILGKKMESIHHSVSLSNIIAQYLNGKDKGMEVY